MPKVRRVHHAQHGAKKLGHVSKTTRRYVPPDTRTQQARVVLVARGFEQPLFATLQLLDTLAQRSIWFSNQRGNEALGMPGGTDHQAASGVVQLALERLIVVQVTVQNQKAASTALLP